MTRFLSAVIFAFLIVFLARPIFADSQLRFQDYMDIWTENSSLASQYLQEAEKALKGGDELQGCAMQSKAGDYGIQATEALIEAFKISDQTDGLSNLEAGLNKWMELRDFC